MAIPSLPPFFKMKLSDEKGDITQEGHLYFDETFQTTNELVELTNRYVSDDGLTVPNKTPAEIIALEPAANIGTLWFNTTLKKLQVKTDSGVIETITST